MKAFLAALLGLLKPLLAIFTSKRFSLAEVLVSNRQARKAGREEARNEGRDDAVADLEEARRARERIRRNSDALERLRDRYR